MSTSIRVNGGTDTTNSGANQVKTYLLHEYYNEYKFLYFEFCLIFFFIFELLASFHFEPSSYNQLVCVYSL